MHPISTPHVELTDILALQRLMDPSRLWVLFEHGTVVVLPSVEDVERAERLARIELAWDRALAPGTAAGDPAVESYPPHGWVVASRDPDVFTFVPSGAVGRGATDVMIGALGRAAHEADVHGGRVLHVSLPEPRDPTPQPAVT